jgi:succinate dehydrogenase flavin-adding protein (antitoxin of CptAB toxin-antitoxin module)
MSVRRLTSGILLCAALIFCVTSMAADKLAELQAHFDRESNPVHRAKLLEKLGDAQFQEARRAYKANDLVTVGIVFEKYRDNARVAFDGLQQKHADAERQSNGYRQLEIHVRRGIREVDEVLLRIPDEYQPPLQLVRKDLDTIDRELIGMLFRHPGDQPVPHPAPPAPGTTPAAPSQPEVQP